MGSGRWSLNEGEIGAYLSSLTDGMMSMSTTTKYEICMRAISPVQISISRWGREIHLQSCGGITNNRLISDDDGYLIE